MQYKNDTGLLSVSDILSPWIDKRWFNERHRQRGSIVHGVMSAYSQSVWHPKIHNDLANYASSGIRWYDANVIRVICSEKRFIDAKNKYTGQVDLIAETVNDGIALIDWKTSASAYGSWAYSTAAYQNLVEINLQIKIDTRMTIRLRKEAGKKCLVNYWEDQNDLPIFLAVAKTINELGFPKGGQ